MFCGLRCRRKVVSWKRVVVVRSNALNKRLRSRVLALGMVGTTLLGAGSILYVQDRAAQAQDKPAAAESAIGRGESALSADQQYAQARKLLEDIESRATARGGRRPIR